MRFSASIACAAILCTLTLSAAQKDFSSRLDFSAPDSIDKLTLDGSGTWEVKDHMLVLTKAGTPGGPITPGWPVGSPTLAAGGITHLLRDGAFRHQLIFTRLP